MNLMGTGMPYSHARRDLSSDVVMKRRFYGLLVLLEQ